MESFCSSILPFHSSNTFWRSSLESPGLMVAGLLGSAASWFASAWGAAAEASVDVSDDAQFVLRRQIVVVVHLGGGRLLVLADGAGGIGQRRR